jgi:hypothetical protein
VAVGIQAALAGVAAHALERHVLRPARGFDHHGVAHHLVFADADRFGIDKMPVAGGRRHVESNQVLGLRIGRQLRGHLDPGLVLLKFVFEVSPFGVRGQGQHQQQGGQDFHARHFIWLRPRDVCRNMGAPFSAPYLRSV